MKVKNYLIIHSCENLTLYQFEWKLKEILRISPYMNIEFCVFHSTNNSLYNYKYIWMA